MKKLTAILLALVSLFTLAIPSLAVDYGAETAPAKEYTVKFSDVAKDHWAFTYVAELVDRGAINGYPDGNFRPSNTVTRAEFSKIMTVAAGLEPKKVTTTSFVDVPITHWCSPFLEASKAFMTGYKVGDYYYFKPDNAALREDIAVAVVKLKGYDTRLADLSMLKAMFTDYDSISEALRPYVAIAVENGIVSGYPDETFRAQATITRAEAAAMLWRAFQYGNDNKVPDIDGETDEDKDTDKDAETDKDKDKEEEKNDETSSKKPYKIETLVRANSAVTSMTVDGQNNVYYIQDNKVMKLNGASSSVVMDGNAMGYTISDAELLGDVFGYEADDPVYGKYITGDEGVTFSKFEIMSLVYDSNNSRMLALGEYPDTETYYPRPIGWGTHKVSRLCVYEVSETPTLVKEAEYSFSHYRPEDGATLLGDEIIFKGIYGLYSFDINATADIRTFAYPPKDRFGNYYRHSYLTVLSNGKIAVTNISEYNDRQWFTVSTYDFGKESWSEEFSCVGGYKNGNKWFAWREDNFYAVNDSEIRKTNIVAGKSGPVTTTLLTFDDIEFVDNKSIRVVSDLAVISDKQFVLYDATNGLIRQISPNK
jgi:hypothetical protein